MKAFQTVGLLGLLTLVAGPMQGAGQPTNADPATPPPGQQQAGEANASSQQEQDGEGIGVVTEGQDFLVSTDTQTALDWLTIVQLANHKATSEILPSVDRLGTIVTVAIAVSLAGIVMNVLVLVFVLDLRRRASAEPARNSQVHKAAAAAPESPSTTPPGAVKEVVQIDSPEADSPSARLETPLPPAKPARKLVERPQPSPPEPDEFASLPHAAVGRVLSLLHRELPGLAGTIGDPRQQQRFLAELDLPLKARIERFKDAAHRGDAYLQEHWIEQDLVTTLNTLAQMLSSVIEERHRGRRGNRVLEEELSKWLYEKLAPVCQAEGWFAVESILPFMTRFDPKIHHSVGSVELDGADNLIVTIKAIGRRDAGRGFVTHKAEVIVGR